jgi:hypothetical protein
MNTAIQDADSKILDRARRLRTKRQFFHPTIAPFMISILIILFFFLVGSVFHIYYPKWFQNILFLLFSISIGISGLIILKRGEFIEKFGRIKRGWYAYSIGILFILFGLVTTLSGLYNIFFK